MATSVRSRKRQSANGSKPAAQPAETTVDLDISAATADEQPQPEQPEPTIVVEKVPVVYYRPRVTLPDGSEIVCEHRYLHESEKLATACGRRIAARGAFVK